MKLTFLGTSAGKPTKERNVSALGLEFTQDNKWYLFDCGEATQHQIIRSKLSIGKIDSIFITHLHGDHYYGLLGLLSTKKLDIALKSIRIFGPIGIKKFLECSMDITFDYLHYKLDIIEFDAYDNLIFDNFSIKVLPLVHSIDSYAFHIKENDICNKLNVKKLKEHGLEPSPLYGTLKKGKSIFYKSENLNPKEFMLEPIIGRSLIIAGDNSTPGILGDYLKNLDLLVHECTYTKEIYDNLGLKVLHTTATDLGQTAQKMHIKNTIATHISPRYNKKSKFDIQVLYDEIKENYSGNLFIANDFDVFTLNRDKKLNLIFTKGKK